MIDAEKLEAFENLQWWYSVLRVSSKKTQSGRREYSSRDTVKTKLGELEQDEWIRRAKKLIKENGELSLQDALQEYVCSCIPWIHSDEEQEVYALKLHMDRIFDDPEWVDYVEFNDRYRHKDAKKAAPVKAARTRPKKKGLTL